MSACKAYLISLWLAQCAQCVPQWGRTANCSNMLQCRIQCSIDMFIPLISALTDSQQEIHAWSCVLRAGFKQKVSFQKAWPELLWQDHVVLSAFELWLKCQSGSVVAPDLQCQQSLCSLTTSLSWCCRNPPLRHQPLSKDRVRCRRTELWNAMNRHGML